MKKTICLLAFLFLISCKKEEVVAKKESLRLDHYTETIKLTGFGVQSVQKIQYEYDASGKLHDYAVSDSSFSTGAFEPQRYVELTYETTRVIKVEVYLTGANTPYLQDLYQYLPDGRVSKITEVNHAAVVTSEANFNYNATDASVKVNYTYSTGGSSEYEFWYPNQNIQHDKTTQGGELCNEGAYTYDTKVNPFHTLGYVDFAFVNFSANNLLTQEVNYVACSTATFVQGPHVYEYNAHGYPTLVTTTYKNDSRLTSERRFYYKPTSGL